MNSNNTGIYYSPPSGTGLITNTTGIAFNSNQTLYSIYPSTPTSDIFHLSSNGVKIVTVTKDGEIIWHQPNVRTDVAVEEFSRLISLTVEQKAGVQDSVKARIRDSVFEDLISIATTKGPMTASDLTDLLKASKIIENLKGKVDL